MEIVSELRLNMEIVSEPRLNMEILREPRLNMEILREPRLNMESNLRRKNSRSLEYIVIIFNYSKITSFKTSKPRF